LFDINEDDIEPASYITEKSSSEYYPSPLSDLYFIMQI